MKIELWPNGAPFAMGNDTEDRPVLNAFLLDNRQEKRSAFIICPGGGYRRRAEHEGTPIAEWLNKLGIAAFVLDYRITPYRHPVPLMDAQRAIRIVRHRADEWGIDPNRIGIIGFSAGGHLSATAATHFDDGDPNHVNPIERIHSRPDAVVLCYPVISFGEYGHLGSRDHLLGDDASAEQIFQLSMENCVSASMPPTFLWHTVEDEPVPVENSLLFAKALSRTKIPYEMHIFPHGRHGLGLAEEDPYVGNWTTMCERWLTQVGFCGSILKEEIQKVT